MTLDVYVWVFYRCFVLNGLVIFLLGKTKKVGLVFWCAKTCEKKCEKCLRKFCHMEKKTYICGIVLHNVWRVQRSHINDIIV